MNPDCWFSDSWSENPYGHTMVHCTCSSPPWSTTPATVFGINPQFLAVAASLGETSFVIMGQDLNANSKAPEFVSLNYIYTALTCRKCYEMLSMIRMD